MNLMRHKCDKRFGTHLLNDQVTVASATHQSGERQCPVVLIKLTLTIWFLYLCIIPCANAQDIRLEVLLELDPLDWSSIYPTDVINQCTLALNNKSKLKDIQISRLYLLRGIAQIFVGKTEAAIEDLTESLKSRPNDFQALRFRGDAYSILGEYGKGLADFKTLLKLQPKSAVGYASLALCLSETGHKDESKKCAESAITLDPYEPLGYLARAETNLRDNYYQHALKDLNKCVTLSLGHGTPIAKRPFVFRAALFLNIYDDPRKALPDLLMARRLDSYDNVISAMFCEYYFKTGRYNMAFRLSELLPKGEKNRSDMLGKRVVCLLEQSRYEDALQVAESMIRHTPRWHGSYLYRGNVHFSQKMYKDALQDYDKSLDLRHDNFAAMATKSYLLSSCPEAHFRDGSVAKSLAIKCCERTEYQVPRQLMLLAMACAECGDYKEAVSWAKKSIEKADSTFPFLEDYRQRLALFEKGKPYRFSPDSRVFDYLW